MIELNGIYNGKNLYVQNPFSSNGVGFCVIEVLVNGQNTQDEISSSAFEIDLKACNLRQGDAVKVVIYHKQGCTPKVLNPEVLKPRSTFDMVSIQVVQEGANCFLAWETKNEQGKLNFIIEQYRWNKWVAVSETEGGGQPGQNNYKVKVVPHSGSNTYRVKQIDYTGQPKTSKSAVWMSNTPAVTFDPIKANNVITFSAETLYEIYDQYGNIIKKGFGKEIDVKPLAVGSYFLNYDNIAGQFSRIR